MRSWLRAALLALIALAGSGPATAQSEPGFRAYLAELHGRALAQGVSARTLDAVLPTLTYNPRVVALDRDQPGGPIDSPIPPFAPYRATHVNAERIGGGRTTYQRLRPRLVEIERRFGVPGKVAIAIYGHETGYGSFTGDFDLARSLATLAYEGRRRALFEPELIATLEMIDRGIPRSTLVGSWAGAFGYPQFLPSVYLRLAVDGDGDGRAEIWRSEADALASIANYLENAGWRRGEPWGIAVNVPRSFDRAAIANRTNATRCPRVHERHSRWLTMAEWRARGIVPQGGGWPDDGMMASLLEPDGPGNTAYLLTNNYRVILDYNCSNFYALSVGLLADEITR
ncbi:MAG: lytic murein transglycosylase [Sphingomonadaceae bacterium]|nr:lytic murein transglycosylase [Sphingomonadaceae bacterium]